MENRALFPDSLEVGLLAYFDDEYPRHPSYVDKIFKMGGSTKQKEELSGTTGVSKLSNVGEGGSVPYEERLEDFKTVLTHATYKRGVKVTQEQEEDDQYQSNESRTRALAKAAARTADHNAFSVLRNAFTSTSTSYGDGEELASTSHDRLDGGTVRSNASATGVVLSETNLEVGMLAADEALDHKGELLGNMGRGQILVAPLALRKKSLEIVQSPLRSNGNNNDLNYYALGDIDIFVNPWIGANNGGSDTAWHLIRKDQQALHFLWRKRPVPDMERDFDTGVLKMKIEARFSYGWRDPIGETWHSAGDGAAYSS